VSFALLPGAVEGFLVAFARIGALVMLLPGLGERALPARARLVLALLLTLAALPALGLGGTTPGPPLLIRLIGEVLTGLALGLSVRLVLAALDVAASIAAQTVGLSFAQVLDPTQGQQAEILTTFFRLFGVVLIFATDLHHLALAGIVASFQALPVGRGLPVDDLAGLVVRIAGEVLHAGVRIAAPFMVFGLVFNLGLGMASRMAPQVQLFYLAMPLALMLGLAGLGMMLGAGGTQFLTLYSGLLETLVPAGR
jgi:flagellar biosynthetic protein FliR